MASKRTELELAERECAALQERSREAEEAVKKSRAHFQAVTAGLSSGSDGQDDTLAAQKIGGCGPRRVLGRPILFLVVRFGNWYTVVVCLICSV